MASDAFVDRGEASAASLVLSITGSIRKGDLVVDLRMSKATVC